MAIELFENVSTGLTAQIAEEYLHYMGRHNSTLINKDSFSDADMEFACKWIEHLAKIGMYVSEKMQGNVYEFGCGMAIPAITCALLEKDANHRVIALDQNSRDIESAKRIAKRLGIEIELMTCDIIRDFCPENIGREDSMIISNPELSILRYWNALNKAQNFNSVLSLHPIFIVYPEKPPYTMGSLHGALRSRWHKPLNQRGYDDVSYGMAKSAQSSFVISAYSKQMLPG